jgi:hypothetical protein
LFSFVVSTTCAGWRPQSQEQQPAGDQTRAKHALRAQTFAKQKHAQQRRRQWFGQVESCRGGR